MDFENTSRIPFESTCDPNEQIREHIAAIQFVKHFVPTADSIDIDDPNFDRDLIGSGVGVRPVNQSGHFRDVG